MTTKITRIDLSDGPDVVPERCLNRVRDGVWQAQNMPELADVDLREVSSDADYLLLRGPSSAIEVRADLRDSRLYMTVSGKPTDPRPILNVTMRPGPWLINTLRITLPNGAERLFHRLDEEAFADAADPGLRYGIEVQDARYLQLRKGNTPYQLRFDLPYGRAYGALGDGPFGEVGVIQYDTDPNARLATLITGVPGAEGAFDFVRVGPAVWVERSEFATNGTVMRVTAVAPDHIELTGPPPANAVWRVNTVGETVQGGWVAANGTGSAAFGHVKITYGPHKWRRGQRISCRSALAADPFHGTGQPGAKALHPDHADVPMVYRTTIKLPPMAKYVDIRSVEQVEVDINHRRFQLDRTRHHRVVLSRGRIVTVTLPATDLSCPTLEVRASTMENDDWHPVHPDVEVHKRLVRLSPQELKRAQKVGHLPKHLTGQQLTDLHKTVTGLARTIQYTHNPKSHGIHRDKAVHPPNMLHPHFHVKFAPAVPGLPPSPVHTAHNAGNAAAIVHAMQSHPNFQRLDTPAGQGFFDFFKQAGEAIVHTVEKVGGDFIDTAKHVVKDVGDTIDHVGEHLVHGDIVGVAHDLLEGGEHIGSDIGHGLVSAGGHVIKGASQVLVMTLKAANGVFQFVLDHTGVIGQAIRWVLEKAGVVVGKFLRAFLDVFGWEDVLHTHEVIAGTLDQGLERMAVFAGDVKKASDSFFQDLIADIEDPLNKIISAIEPHGMTRQALPAPGHSQAMETLEWLFGQVTSHSPLSPPKPPRMPWQQGDPDDQLGNFLHATFGSNNEILEGILGKAVFELELIADDIAHAPQHLLAALLEVVRDALSFGLKAVSRLIDMLLDVLALAFRTFRKLLGAEITIPIVSEFYYGLTGKKLTMLSLVSLLVAIPATVISKATLGRSAFAGVGVGQSSDPNTLRAWGYTYASAQLALTVTAAVDDVLSIKDAYNFDIEIDPQKPTAPQSPAQVSATDTGISTLDLAFGLLAQITASPVTPDQPYELPHPAERFDPLKQANFWAHTVWMYQWAGFAMDFFTKAPVVITGIAGKNAEALKGLEKAQDVIAVVTTVRGLVHLPLMVAINDGDSFRRDVIENFFVANARLVTMAQLDMPDDQLPNDPSRFNILFSRRNLASGLKAFIGANAQAQGAEVQDLLEHGTFPDTRSPTDTETMTTREWLVAQRDFLNWANGTGHDNTMPMNEKLFGNICDCLPEIGQVMAAPKVAAETAGLTLIGAAVFDVFGHMAESVAYFKRTAKDELL